MKLCPRSALIAFVFSIALAACGGGTNNSTVDGNATSGGADGGGTDGGGSEPAVRSPAGVWRGTSSTGRAVAGVVFDNGDLWFSYTAEQSSLAAGVVTGQVTVDSEGRLTGFGTDFNLDGAGAREAELSGEVVARQSLVVDVVVDGESVLQFTGEYSVQDEQPADLSTVLGAFAGTASTVTGAETSEIIVGDAGMLAGVAALGCTFAGSVSPRSDINVFDVSLSFGGDGCLFANVQASGVAWIHGQQTFMATVVTETDNREVLVFSGLLDTATAE